MTPTVEPLPDVSTLAAAAIPADIRAAYAEMFKQLDEDNAGRAVNLTPLPTEGAAAAPDEIDLDAQITVRLDDFRAWLTGHPAIPHR